MKHLPILLIVALVNLPAAADDSLFVDLEKGKCPDGSKFVEANHQDIVEHRTSGKMKTCVVESKTWALVIDKKSVEPRGPYSFYDKGGLLLQGMFVRGYPQGLFKKRADDGKMIDVYYWDTKRTSKDEYLEKKAEADCTQNNGDACFEFATIMRKKNDLAKAKELTLKSCELKSQQGCDGKKALEQEDAIEAKKVEESKQESLQAEKLQNSAPCKRAYILKNYCISLGELKSQQAKLDYENELSKRSGATNLLTRRKLTQGIMWIEKQIAKEKTYFEKFKGQTPPLSACKLKSDESNYFEPDESTTKLFNDTLVKNCGTDEPRLDL